MADNAAFTPGSGGTLATFDTGTAEWPANIIGYVTGGSAGAWTIQHVTSSLGLPISDAGGSITVDNGGTFAVQAAQSGTWNITNISGTVSLPTGAATAAKQPALGTAGTASADVITVQGIASMTALKVDGSAVTQPVSGTFWQATQPVSIATVPSHDVTNAGTFAVQVSSALPAGTNNIGDVDVLSVPSDPFGANADAASATGSISAKLRFIASTGIPITGTVTVGSHAVTNAGTFVVQENGAALTALQLIDDTVATLGTTTYSEATTKGLTIGAVRRDADTTLVDTTNEIGPLQMDANGRLKVEAFSGETLPVSLTSTTVTGTVAVTQSGTWDEVGINDSGNSITVDAPVGTPVFVRLSDGASAISTLPVSLASVPSHAVTNAGTFVVQVDGTALTRLTDIETNTDSGAVVGNGAAATAQRVTLANDSTGIVALTTSTASIGKLASNTGVTIGAVEIAASQTLATVTTVSTVTTCSTVTTLTGGGVAHDGADSGNPVKVGARAAATLSDDTMVANGDRTDAVSDLDGVLLMRGGFPLGDLISERVSNTDGNSTAFSNFGATASTRSYITAISLFNSSATAGYVDFRDGTAGSVLYTVAIPAGGGAIIAMGGSPLFRTSSNTALAYDVSAALSTVYISVTGYKSKV